MVQSDLYIFLAQTSQGTTKFPKATQARLVQPDSLPLGLGRAGQEKSPQTLEHKRMEAPFP